MAQTVRIRSAEPAEFVGVVDSNSPAYWANGTRHLYNSIETAIRSEGALTPATKARAVIVNGGDGQRRWIESVHFDGEHVFAWYHTERAGVCPGTPLAVPAIGAMLSDDGIHFDDLGIILEAPGEPDCASQNTYFAGGLGDFTVVPDRAGEYLYFLFSNYGGPLEQQGIATARLAFADRWDPAGKVWKFRAGAWDEPGRGGVADPIFPAFRAWTSERPLALWGPSVHWNSALQQYVALMNQAIDGTWSQGGIYVSFSADLANPASWSAPVELMYADGWYPQVLGSGEGETDSLAGRQARLFMMGKSDWELIFESGPARIIHEFDAAAKPRNASSSRRRRAGR